MRSILSATTLLLAALGFATTVSAQSPAVSPAEADLAKQAEAAKRELEALLAGFRDLILAGPGPAPLAKAESYYRFQIMIRTKAMSRLASVLDPWCETLALPDDVRLTLDIDPVDLM